MIQIKYRATTPNQRALGLSAMPKLNDGEALLMEFPTSQMSSIWNKGVKYDIDIGFIDENLILLSKHKLKADDGKSQTPLVFSNQPILYVIETKQGDLDNYAIGSSFNKIINRKNERRTSIMQLFETELSADNEARKNI